MRVQSGDNVMIGGFIITGSGPKNIVIRALGPSLQQAGLADVLNDPVLELRGPDGAVLSQNDNWRDNPTVAAQLQGIGFAPQNNLESAIITTLVPGAYTATVHGRNGTTGNGLVELYDLNQDSSCELANISTRGFVQQGDAVMIGGFMLGGDDPATVLVRAVGPSLAQFGVTAALSDPALELHDGNGALIQRNTGWRVSQESAIRATGMSPADDREAAIVADLVPGAYTAIVSGENGAAGVALVEIFNLP
jgi:hypothetical protein